MAIYTVIGFLLFCLGFTVHVLNDNETNSCRLTVTYIGHDASTDFWSFGVESNGNRQIVLGGGGSHVVQCLLVILVPH